MPPPYPVPDPVLLVHITDVTNLPSILSDGCLYSHNKLVSSGKKPKDISYSNIQEKRAKKLVPCGPGGSLHDYVPMFFGTKPPMLYAISKGNVAGAVQDTIIYLISALPRVKAQQVPYVFTDGHGIVATTEFFTDDADMRQVDWPLMKQMMWNETEADPDRPRRRQAEFLVKDSLPWAAVEYVATFNEAVAAQATAALQAQGGDVDVPVLVRKGWYY